MTWHANAASIHKGAYIQSSDPGAVGAKVLWFDTTSGFVLKKRNDANSGWDTIADLGGIASFGDVDGPASSTDNAIARFDGTTGKLIQNSVVVVSDAGAITVPEISAPSTPASGTVHIYAKSDGKLYIKDDTGAETDLTTATANIAPLVIENADEVGQRNGTTNQNLNIYGSFVDGTNYSRIRIGFTSGAAQIFSEGGSGGGTVSNVLFKVGTGVSLNLGGGSLVPSTDVAFSLGSSSGYFNEIYNQTWITKSGGILRFVSGGRLSGPASGVLLIRDDSNNAASATIRFEMRTPATITSDQNNYDVPVPSKYVRLATDASRTMTGLTFASRGADVSDGEEHVIINVGANDLVLAHESGSSTAVNRFLNSTGANITLGANQAADVVGDAGTQRWRVFKRN